MRKRNKGADQPAHQRSLLSAFVIAYPKSKATRPDISQYFVGLQHDNVSGYAHALRIFLQKEFHLLHEMNCTFSEQKAPLLLCMLQFIPPLPTLARTIS